MYKNLKITKTYDNRAIKYSALLSLKCTPENSVKSQNIEYDHESYTLIPEHGIP